MPESRMTETGSATSALRQSLSDATARIDGILDAAERAAIEIHDEAEAEAAQLLERRARDAEALEREAGVIHDSATSLRSLARHLGDEAETAAAELDVVLERLERRRGIGAIPAEDVGESNVHELPGRRFVSPTRGGDEPSAADVKGPLLLAAQLAITGSDRGEIDNALRERFAVDDTSAILDQVLGPS